MKHLFSIAVLLMLLTVQAAAQSVNFTIGSGAHFVVSNRANVVMDTGTLTNNGNYTDSTGTFIAAGGVTFSGTGTTHFSKLRIDNSQHSLVSSPVSVYDTITVAAGALDANGQLHLRSDVNDAAMLIVDGLITHTLSGIKTYASTTSGPCPSFTTNLTVNVQGTSVTYQWQISSDDVSWTDISGATATAYTATVTATSYYRCFVTTGTPPSGIPSLSVLVTMIGTLPDAGTITGASTVCAGSSTSLSDTVSGGTWSSSDTGIATVDTSGLVSGVSGGTITISYTATNSCGSTYALHTITVNTIPDAGPITGTAAFCSGSTSTLSGATGGGTWSSLNTSVATIGSGTGVVSGVGPGTATISYVVGNTCGTNGASLEVTVNSAPAAGPITGTAAACAGATTTLSGASGGGIWTSADTSIATVDSASGVVTGISAGTTMISYTAGNECGENLATVTVTINIAPTAGPISGTTAVCTSATTPLTGAASGGIWTSTNTAIASIGSTTGIVTGISAGSVTISYTASNECGTDIATTVVSVNTTPTAGPISGTAALCAGASTTLSGAISGGSWISANNSVATVDSPGGLVNGISAGTAVISYQVSNECGTGTATTIVTVNALPNAGTISGASTVCETSNTTLSSGSPGGTWTSSNTAIATVGSTGTVSGINPGTISISYTVTNGCGTAIATHAMTVTPLPIAATISGESSVTVLSSISLSASIGGGTWSSSNTATATVNSSGTVTGVAPGTATISYRTSNSCGTATATTVITVDPAFSTPITGTLTVCEGGTTTLANTTPGGVWSSGNTSIATVGVSSGTVTGAAAGTALISYTLSGTSVTAIVTVNAAPASITGATAVCVNGTIVLSDADGGGTWSSSNTSLAEIDGSGMVTGLNSGSVRISYTNSNGCYRTRSITVNPLPAVITGVTNVCTGGTTILSDATSGGMSWTSGNTSVAIIGSSSGVVTGIAPGTAAITYTLTTGCATKTIVTVNSAAGSISGLSSLCTGTTQTFTASGGGTWSSSTTAVGTISSTGTLTAIAAGTTVISFTGTAGCVSTRTVSVSASPAAISGSGLLCSSSSVTLSCATTGGTWSSSNTSVANIASAATSSAVIEGLSSGTATVSYTNAAGCSSTLDMTVSAAVASTTGTNTLCAGQSISLTNGSDGGTWSSSNTAVATVGTTGIVTGVVMGTANISYSLSSGCYAVKQVTVNGALGAILGTNNTCEGSSATLTHATAGGYWESSNNSIAIAGSATGIISGVSAGSVTISYIISEGCYKTRSFTVKATPPAIGGTLSLCEGTITVLTNAVSLGAWSSANTAIATINGGGVVTGVAAGTVIMSYTKSGCTTTTTVTVNGLPGSISGTAAVCVGATSVLSGSPSGGTWHSSNTTKVTVDGSGNITGVAAGTAVISYTLGTGCVGSIVATATALPGTISGSLSVCTGGSTSLSCTPGGGTWASSSPTTASISSGGVMTGLATGNSTITYTSAAGCSRTAEATVNAALSANTGSPQVCVGQTTVLSNSTTGGTWSSSNTAQATVGATTGIVTGVATGTSNITYNTGAGCFAVTQVTVSSSPGDITGASTVCQGNTITLGAPVSGGTWSSSNTARATVNSGTGEVTGVSGGSVIITYSVGTGCFQTKTITVYDAPGTITGTTIMCEGTTTVLTCETGTSWVSSNTAVATIGITSGVVTGVSAGTSEITFQATSGCTVSTVVTVLALPADITGTPEVCVSATTTLSCATTGGTWASSLTYRATVDASGVVTGMSAGNCWISYTAPDGCYKTVSVTINTLPALPAISGPGNMPMGGSVTIAATVPDGVWTTENAAIATVSSTTATAATLSGVSLGNVWITYTVTNGCGSKFRRRRFTVVAPRPGLSETTEGTGEAMVRIYPNPNTGSFVVTAPVKGAISIFTIDGRAVGTYDVTENGTAIILPANLATGMYMCKFKGEDGSSAMAELLYQP